MENPFSEIYRLCNDGSNVDKYRMIREGEIVLPRYLDVELTNLCNFHCRFCPTGTKSVNRVKGYMPDAVVDALVANVKKYHIPGVRFIRWGEPTMHPKFVEILKKVKSVGAKIHINTNGSILDEGKIRELLDIPLDSIKFSFQGADEDTYQEMRQGGEYLHLLSTVKLMYNLQRRTLCTPHTYIQISTTLTGETAEQVESFKHDVGNICDFYNIGYTKLNHLDVDKMDISEVEKEKIRVLQQQETIHSNYRKICYEAFDKLSINWNGDVTLCCSDYDNFMLVGNLLDMDIKELFNSHAADAYRQMIVNGEYGRIKCCSTCYETVPLVE